MAGTISPEMRRTALELLRARGIGTSDCRLVWIRAYEPGHLELRSASGLRRLAVIVLTTDLRPVDVIV